MKINLYNHITNIGSPSAKCCLALGLILLIPLHSFTQKKLTDSLLQKKFSYENSPGFVAADTNYIKVLYELARSYIYQIPDSTKSISERVLHMSEQAGFEKGMAGGKLGLGLYYNVNGEFQEASKHLKEAEKRAKNVHAKKLLLKCINTKAMGQFMQGNYPQAYLECKAGESLAKKIDNKEMQVFFAMNLATCFAILKDYGQALPYYQKALQIVNQSNDLAQRAQIESNLGYMYLYTGDYEKAKENCKKAIEVLNQEKHQAWESFAWATLGEVAIREKKYDSALEYFSKSEALLMPIEDMQRKAETYQGIADAHYWKGNTEKSLEYAKMAENISKDISYHWGIVKSSELLHKLYNAQDKPREALKHLRVAKHLSDSILESDNKTKFLMLEAQTNFNKEMELIDLENEKKLARQKTITYISIVLFLALVVIALLIRKNAINQKKANLSLQELNNTKDKLFSIIGHDLKSPIGTLQELLNLYTSKEISEKDVAQLAPRLKQNVDHSAFTLNNLLYWAKTQMNGVKPNIKPVSVKKAATSVCDLYQNKIKAKNIEVNCSIDPKLKALVDPMHLDIILRNIITNAIKFTPHKGEIRFNSQERDGRVTISIRDSGIGMNKETMDSLFTAKYVNPRNGTDNEKGTGLGLQISKELIAINHGELNISSKLGKGSCFYILFPIG